MKWLLGKLWVTIRFGLLVHHLRWWMARLGVIFFPYYMIREGTQALDPEAFAVAPTFDFGPFDESDAVYIGQHVPQHPEAVMRQHLATGHLCFGLKHHGEMAVFSWIDLNTCRFRKLHVPLDPHEAYLFDMYTLEPFRGQNLAPYLRYKIYQELRAMGRTTYYSISDALNRPAVKFKQKLHAEFLWLGLYVRCFGKYEWHGILKRYEAAASPAAASLLSRFSSAKWR